MRPSSPPPAAGPEPIAPVASTDKGLVIEGLAKAFGRYPALKSVSLRAAPGEFLALLGPSGSGKTTLLRILAGLEAPDAGAVRFEGEDFLGLTARQRRVGMVFQHYALFGHMTVARNIAFGLTVRPRSARPSRAAIAAKVEQLLALMQLDGYADRYPAQLSGGQRQRVALARALAIEPRLLLLDEPFGALDAKVRRDLRRWLREIHDRTGVSTVFVTHDQEEALDLADRVAILHQGRLVQVGAPQEVWERPADPFVYDFLGPSVRVEGRVENGRLRLPDWETAAPTGAPEGPVVACFRPHETELRGGDAAGLPATVVAISRRGPDARVEADLFGALVSLQAPADAFGAALAPGARLRLAPMRPMVFPQSPAGMGEAADRA